MQKKSLISSNSFLSSFFKILLLLIIFILPACGLYDPVSSRDIPTNAEERSRKNIKEGRGVSVSGLFKGGSTNYEFSSSNPMWRASLEILDFLPFTVVDYSGGMLVTDWYSDEINSKNSLKITLRFLSNEIQTNSLKIIVHQKKCSTNANCSIKILDSKIKEELLVSILRKAAVLNAEIKKK